MCNADQQNTPVALGDYERTRRKFTAHLFAGIQKMAVPHARHPLGTGESRIIERARGTIANVGCKGGKYYGGLKSVSHCGKSIEILEKVWEPVEKPLNIRWSPYLLEKKIFDFS